MAPGGPRNTQVLGQPLLGALSTMLNHNTKRDVKSQDTQESLGCTASQV
jgi:hypothetical protein